MVSIRFNPKTWFHRNTLPLVKERGVKPESPNGLVHLAVEGPVWIGTVMAESMINDKFYNMFGLHPVLDSIILGTASTITGLMALAERSTRTRLLTPVDAKLRETTAAIQSLQAERVRLEESDLPPPQLDAALGSIDRRIDQVETEGHQIFVGAVADQLVEHERLMAKGLEVYKNHGLAQDGQLPQPSGFKDGIDGYAQLEARLTHYLQETHERLSAVSLNRDGTAVTNTQALRSLARQIDLQLADVRAARSGHQKTDSFQKLAAAFDVRSPLIEDERLQTLSRAIDQIGLRDEFAESRQVMGLQRLQAAATVAQEMLLQHRELLGEGVPPSVDLIVARLSAAVEILDGVWIDEAKQLVAKLEEQGSPLVTDARTRLGELEVARRLLDEARIQVVQLDSNRQVDNPVPVVGMDAPPAEGATEGPRQITAGPPAVSLGWEATAPVMERVARQRRLKAQES